jgi:hypothetical protein
MKILPCMLLFFSSACVVAAPLGPPLTPRRAATVQALPTALIVSCDPGGCWDENGVRYDAAGDGIFIRVDGRSCESIRGRMVCK